MPLGFQPKMLPSSGVDPADWTDRNIAQMREQLQRLGFSIDWSREVATCHSDYYRWTQWLLQFLNADLAYRKEATVNWDLIDQTVLANEQVDADGRSWRSGALVEKRKLRQWFLKITAVADELLDDLEQLKGWPERVRTMQANWIGRSNGATLRFAIAAENEQAIEVFTTRPDTVFGVSYVVLAPDMRWWINPPQRSSTRRLRPFRKSLQSISEQDRVAEDRPKRGVATGGSVQHPFTGEAVPVWIADYVLPDYGTGAAMGVPAHDSRDFAFAKQYDLPITTVVVEPGHAADSSEPTKPSPVWGSWWAPLNLMDCRGSRPKRPSRPPNNAGWRSQDHLPAARLVDLAATLLGLPDPSNPLR